MREILFKGKRIDNGEWVISDCFYQCDGEIKLWDSLNRDGWVNVKPETIGRYIGLKDKNGKKIFEGDIVQSITEDTHEKRFAVIKFGKYRDANFEDSAIGFYFEIKGCQFSMFSGEAQGYDLPSLVEVIGNVFDNPELKENEV